MIDDRLNFNNHVAILCKKLRRAGGIIFKLSSFLPTRILRILYNSIFLPHLVYCIEVWGNTGVVNMRRVAGIQNRVVKLLGDGDLLEIYRLNNILPVNNLFKYFLLLKFYQHHVLRRGVQLNDAIASLEPIHQYPTRFSEGLCLNVPRVHRSKFYSSFLYRGITFWNQLPVSFHDVSSLGTFKRKLRAHIKAEICFL